MIERTTHFQIFLKRTTEGSPFQYMVVVPSRVAPLAVQRHTLKRKVSEAVRRILQHTKTKVGIQAIIRVSVGILPSPVDLEHELLSLIHKSGILNK